MPVEQNYHKRSLTPGNCWVCAHSKAMINKSKLLLVAVAICSVSAQLPRCMSRRDGTNYMVLSGGHDPRRLTRLAGEFARIGANYTVLDNSYPSPETMARYPAFNEEDSRTTSSGGSASRLRFGHFAMLERAVRRGAAPCSCLFEDDVVFHPDFKVLFQRYLLRRHASASAWQLGSFTRDLGDWHPSRVPYFQHKGGWVPGFEVGAHAYCVSDVAARKILRLAAAERGPPLPIDIWLRDKAGHLFERLTDRPPEGVGMGNSMGIAYQQACTAVRCR